MTKKYITNGINGIWNSYGCPVNPDEGLQLSVEDSGIGTESLIDLLGLDREKKDIGLLRDHKSIYELVVMLPMLSSDIEYPDPPKGPIPENAPIVDPCAPCDIKRDPCSGAPIDSNPTNFRNYFFGNLPFYSTLFYQGEFHYPYGYKDMFNYGNPFMSDVLQQPAGTVTPGTSDTSAPQLYFSKTEGAYLFTIRESLINKILGVTNYKILSIFNIKSILENKKDLNYNNNIVKLMIAMINFNIPPHLNWLNDTTLPPIAMYTATFKTYLSKQDLSNIWQGTMPHIAENPSEEEIIIEHYLTEEEMFGGYNIAEMDNIQLSVFKCKQRAANDYYSTLKTSDTRSIPWYQYNWPYDYFSLVELLKIEGGEVFEKVDVADVAESVLVTVAEGAESAADVKDTQYSTTPGKFKQARDAHVAATATYTKSLYE